MNPRIIAIQQYSQIHSVEETAILVKRLFGKDSRYGWETGKDEKWITVNGTPVRLDKEGKTTTGPKRLKSSINGKNGVLSNNKVHSLCKLDKRIYSCVTKDIQTRDVVVTNERLQHVVETHPEISREEAYEMMRDAIMHPNMIIQDSHKDHEKDTAVVMKRVQGKEGSKTPNMRLILRLSTRQDGRNKKNSVITAVLTTDKKWKKYAKNKKILYNSDDQEL